MVKRTKNPVLGFVGSSIITTGKTLLNVYEDIDNEIKSIDELYETGKLSEADRKIIEMLKEEERKLKKKLEYARNSLKKQIEIGNRQQNLKVKIIEKEKEKEKE